MSEERDEERRGMQGFVILLLATVAVWGLALWAVLDSIAGWWQYAMTWGTR